LVDLIYYRSFPLSEEDAYYSAGPTPIDPSPPANAAAGDE
jgi:hypothetical protein